MTNAEVIKLKKPIDNETTYRNQYCGSQDKIKVTQRGYILRQLS